jgi:ParB-like chromosome segregation protein Spo0J
MTELKTGTTLNPASQGLADLDAADAESTATEIKFHPLADVFPPMEGVEFDELVADIAANGLHEPVTIFEDKVLDGRNRYRACREAGIEAKTEPFEGTEADARAFVISKNIRRRHLTAKERRNFLIELVKAAPGKSDRVLAKEAGTTHPTIAKARKQAEATGKALPVEKRIGADGKARPRR